MRSDSVWWIVAACVSALVLSGCSADAGSAAETQWADFYQQHPIENAESVDVIGLNNLPFSGQLELAVNMDGAASDEDFADAMRVVCAFDDEVSQVTGTYRLVAGPVDVQFSCDNNGREAVVSFIRRAERLGGVRSIELNSYGFEVEVATAAEAIAVAREFTKTAAVQEVTAIAKGDPNPPDHVLITATEPTEDVEGDGFASLRKPELASIDIELGSNVVSVLNSAEAALASDSAQHLRISDGKLVLSPM